MRLAADRILGAAEIATSAWPVAAIQVKLHHFPAASKPQPDHSPVATAGNGG